MKTTTRPLAPRRLARRMPARKTLFARTAASHEEVEDYDAEHEPSMKLSHAFVVVLLLHVMAVGGVIAFSSFRTKHATGDRESKAAAAKPVAAKPAHTDASEAKPAPAEIQPVIYSVVSGDTLKKIATKNKTSVETLERMNDLTGASTLHVGQTLKLPPAKTAAVLATGKPASAPTPKPTTSQKTQDQPAPSKSTVPSKDASVAKTQDAKPAKPADAHTESKETIDLPGKSATPTEKSDKSYVVAQGDNPYTIAKKFKVRYSELLKANQIDDPKKLQIGQKLIIP